MKKILSIIASCILILSLCSCGGNFNKSAYLESAKTVNENIYNSTTTIANYGNYIATYWNTINKFNSNAPGIKSDFDADAALQAADKFLEDKSDETRETMDNLHSTIVSDYNKIKDVKTKDKAIISIDEKISNLYNAYSSLYDHTMNPKGTAKDYLSKCIEYVKTISELSETISQEIDGLTD